MKIVQRNKNTPSRQLINSGMVKVIEAFRSVCNLDVEVRKTTFRVFNNKMDRPAAIRKTGSLVLLTTDMVGEISGKSYLIFSEPECRQIYDACIPGRSNNTTNEPINEPMKEALLLELDNVLSATMITEFSNRLDVKVFGDIPNYYSTDSARIEQLIADDHMAGAEKDHEQFVISNTTFILEKNHRFQPCFIWKMAENFRSRAKRMADAGQIFT